MYPTGLCVMARKHSMKPGPNFLKPCVTSLKCLATINVSHPGPGNNFYNTPIMVVEAVCVNGSKVRLLNTHFHHNPAKREKGFSRAHDHIMEIIAVLIQLYNVHIVTGDFNQASDDITSRLIRRLGVPAFLLARHHELDCILVIVFKLPPYSPTSISLWKNLNGAHWPIALNFGTTKRSAKAKAKRKANYNARFGPIADVDADVPPPKAKPRVAPVAKTPPKARPGPYVHEVYSASWADRHKHS